MLDEVHVVITFSSYVFKNTFIFSYDFVKYVNFVILK